MNTLELVKTTNDTDVTADPSEHVHPYVRVQAQEIIDEILSETGPAEATARTLLRGTVADNPGRPERALLLHLMTFSRP